MFLFQDANLYNMIVWQSCKQNRVSNSTCSPDPYLCNLNEYDCANLKKHTSYSAAQNNLSTLLSVGCQGPSYETIPLHKVTDSRLRPMVSLLKDSFGLAEIATIRWIPESRNFVDTFTKRLILMFRRLNIAMRAGKLERNISGSGKRTNLSIWNKSSSRLIIKKFSFLLWSTLISSRSLALFLFCFIPFFSLYADFFSFCSYQFCSSALLLVLNLLHTPIWIHI